MTSLLLILILSTVTSAKAQIVTREKIPSLGDRLHDCAAIKEDSKRLSCFDTLPLANTPEEEPREKALSEALVETPLKSQKDSHVPQQRYRSSPEVKRKLSANRPNYIAAFTSPTQNSLRDDNHIEFYLSQKYPLFSGWLQRRRYDDIEALEPKIVKPWMPDALYLIYNGLYDFYFYESNRYESSPVISRQQNPGLALEWSLEDPTERFRLGWFHESNGQSLEKSSREGDDFGRDIFNQRLQRHGEDFALSVVSRGWDYASVRYEKRWEDSIAQRNEDWYSFSVEYRWFCDCQAIVSDKEDDIWWEPGNEDKIRDFDGLRLTGEKGIHLGQLDLLGRLELKNGLYSWDAMSNFTWKLSLVTGLENFQLAAFYFDGYGKEPSTYHLRTRYFGIGVELK